MAGSGRPHIKFPEMKQDADPVVLEAAEAAGGQVDLLDAEFDPFAQGVGDPVANERQQPSRCRLSIFALPTIGLRRQRTAAPYQRLK